MQRGRGDDERKRGEEDRKRDQLKENNSHSWGKIQIKQLYRGTIAKKIATEHVFTWFTICTFKSLLFFYC
jgi:hypothetical protein